MDVRDIRELKPENSVYRELALIKVAATAAQREGRVISVTDIFRAKIIDVCAEAWKNGKIRKIVTFHCWKARQSQ